LLLHVVRYVPWARRIVKLLPPALTRFSGPESETPAIRRGGRAKGSATAAGDRE